MNRPGLLVPADCDRTTHPLFYDPVIDADKIAYWQFHNRVIAESMLDFAAEAKRITDDRVPLGTFHGYIINVTVHRRLTAA